MPNSETRQILAQFDEQGIWVYQAFKPSIVRAALEKGTFGAGFSLERMTWIKPSFGWMLYRSGYATKSRQEAIAKVKLSHDGFRQILGQAVLTTYDPALHETEWDWHRALDASDVRVQWDPDRSLKLGRLERRAIQIGLRGAIVRRYVEDWIIGLEEVTELAQAVRKAVEAKTDLPSVPEERLYAVDAVTTKRLGMASDGR